MFQSRVLNPYVLYVWSCMFVRRIYNLTAAAVVQSTISFASHAEGWVFEYQPQQTWGLLIDWFGFYAVSAIFQPSNIGGNKYRLTAPLLNVRLQVWVLSSISEMTMINNMLCVVLLAANWAKKGFVLNKACMRMWFSNFLLLSLILYFD